MTSAFQLRRKGLGAKCGEAIPNEKRQGLIFLKLRIFPPETGVDLLNRDALRIPLGQRCRLGQCNAPEGAAHLG